MDPTMRSFSFRFFASRAWIFAGAWLAVACGPEPSNAPPAHATASKSDKAASAPAAVSSCASRRETAMKQVQSAIDAHRSCGSDRDCATIAFSTLCFDACTRAVNGADAEAVQNAIDRVNQSVCSSYGADHCPRETPPCLPPRAPTCKQGLCE